MPYHKSYENVATSKTPALIIYLIDISGSMKEELDGAPRIEHVNEAIKKVLERMIQRSTKGEVISPRYRLSIVTYSDEPEDLLGKIAPINEIARRGYPQLKANNATDTAAAFLYARDLLRRELPRLSGHPAPMVIHLTDGRFTGSDPEPIAKDIMAMKTDDGNVLVENIYVGPNLTVEPIPNIARWPGIHSASELNDEYAKKLFDMSSLLPESYANIISEEGYDLQPGARMLIPGTNKDLIELAFTMSGATPTA